METRPITSTRDFDLRVLLMHLRLLACIKMYEAHQIPSTFQFLGKLKLATCPGKVNFCPHGGREKLENIIH